MASLTIRNVDDQLEARLRARAATHGQSTEEEVRQILRQALPPDPSGESLADVMYRRFGRLGGVDLLEREQESLRDPPTFDGS